MMTKNNEFTIRREVVESDLETVRSIIDSSGFFRKDEVEVAVELAGEALEKGDASGYHFLFAEMDGQTLGFACFGPIPCTIGSFDLYWIAVHQDSRGKGIGLSLLKETEALVKQMNGRKIYIETSTMPKYDPTRGFYLSAGYEEAARFSDFYDLGDGKVVFEKNV
ncbi:MAG: GNAT family N-acetyltransferase [Bacteroides sp.]|jgi:GNAT superfamily N-acetyltransferase|nr:GNAT family N-acetyltransferase [Bacteroides sp.]